MNYSSWSKAAPNKTLSQPAGAVSKSAATKNAINKSSSTKLEIDPKIYQVTNTRIWYFLVDENNNYITDERGRWIAYAYEDVRNSSTKQTVGKNSANKQSVDPSANTKQSVDSKTSWARQQIEL